MVIISFLVFSLVLIFSVIFLKIIYDPDGSFLNQEKAGIWIREQEPIDLNIKAVEVESTIFITLFDVVSIPSEARLEFKAFRSATVWLDNKCIYRNDEFRSWNILRSLDISQYLSTGRHKLSVEVQNEGGPPALTASCEVLGIRTGDHWLASSDGNTWNKAYPADKIIPPDLVHEFQNTGKAFWSIMPFIGPVFLIILLCSIYYSHIIPGRLWEVHFSAHIIRWIVLGLYTILAINNFFKMPIYMGYDHRGHLQYILYILDNSRLPLVTEGWNMADPPLYYSISALFYSLSDRLFDTETAYRILRLLPLICGAVQIEICYRAMRAVYPDREDLQALGTVIGGLLPINIYVSQFIGTETLAGCLTSLVVLYVFRFISSDSEPKAGFFLSMGVLIGLSMLSKITIILLLPPLMLTMMIVYYERYEPLRKSIILTIRNISLILGCALVLSGWYFIRNYLELGQLIISSTYGAGDSVISSFKWWQDPGYRSFSQLVFSGQALLHPIYSGIFSFWDSLYSTFWSDAFLSGKTVFEQRPPWNYSFMLSSIWLALLPLILIIAGGMRVFTKLPGKLRDIVLFSVLSVGVFLMAVFYQYLAVPSHVMAKAKYMLGIIPCFAVLGAVGLESVLRNRSRVLRGFVLGILICWGLSVYTGYFIWKVSDELNIIDHYKLAHDLMGRGNIVEAADQYLSIKQINPYAMKVPPEFIKALNLNMRSLVNTGDQKAAIKILMKLLLRQLNMRTFHAA